ncbi:MAG: hypothetical protein KDE15_15130 [Erythrobacter sp.]|nr:hypothetical protein [Erythrobacter sp.]
MAGTLLCCAPLACNDPAPAGPGQVSADEAAALEDAREMLDSRPPEPAPTPSAAPAEADGNE